MCKTGLLKIYEIRGEGICWDIAGGKGRREQVVFGAHLLMWKSNLLIITIKKLIPGIGKPQDWN